MSRSALTQHRLFQPTLGALLTVLCGLVLGLTPLGDWWSNASYDYSFRFEARGASNNVVLIVMDNDAFRELHQTRGEPWDRSFHTRLLNKLADDACRLVVMDVMFDTPGDPGTNSLLARAMQRQQAIILAADLSSGSHPGLESAGLVPPVEIFVQAVRTNLGIAKLDEDLDDKVIRRQWPYGEASPIPSLPAAAAQQLGVDLNSLPQQRWLRYYHPRSAWQAIGYHFALDKPTDYFRNKIVFIGLKPKTPFPDGEEDEFKTPYTRWTHEAVGGVELHATSLLNLLNHDWLRRTDWRLEATLLFLVGCVLGVGASVLRPTLALCLALAIGSGLALGGILLSHYGNYWFPWLVVGGGQVPCALAWSLVLFLKKERTKQSAYPTQVSVPLEAPGATVADGAQVPITLQSQTRSSGWGTVLASAQAEEVPDTPDYELFGPPFGQGGFGKVWLTRNAIGQWQALKAVFQSKFGKQTKPFESEFKGITRYKPVSDKHPGLLRVDFVSKKKDDGYFYYVMELGDAHEPGWQENPGTYKPRDLASVRARAVNGRLPAIQCVEIALTLAEALDFLHQQGLTHRDIKPSNIIFVNGQPKLSDVGLVTELRLPEEVTSWVGSPGYMPPPPEPPGTAQADIYAMGMVLYVISTGNDPAPFSSLMPTLAQADPLLLLLTPIILKACQPDCSNRYLSVAELLAALRQVKREFELSATAKTTLQP